MRVVELLGIIQSCRLSTRLEFEDEESIRRTKMADTMESKRTAGSVSLHDDDDEQRWTEQPGLRIDESHQYILQLEFSRRT